MPVNQPSKEVIIILIPVKPSHNDDDHKACSTRGQLFDGYAGERLVIGHSATPLLDACRVLAGEGIDPAIRVVLRHECRNCDALRSTVGAKLTVEEGRRRPIFRRWKPRETVAESQPMRQTEEANA